MISLPEIAIKNHAIRKTWKIAEDLSIISQDVRYAEKPADLTYARSSLIALADIVRDYQMEWLEKKLKLNPQDRGRWPHL